MRICDLTTLYLDGATGGVNTYLYEKARYLARVPGVSHAIIVPGERDEERRLFRSTLRTIKSPPLASNPPHRMLWNFAEVRRLLRAETPSVVEVDCAYFLGKVAAGVLEPRNVPIVGFYHVHLPTFIARPNASRFGATLSHVTERLAWQYVAFCNRVCDRVLVSSRDIYERLAAEGYSRLDHVPLGVNLELFRPESGTGTGTKPTVLLYVGRLSREKDLDVLLQAFRILQTKGDYELRLVGDGAQRAQLEGLAAGDPRIIFHGQCEYGDELARIYASADIFTLPSPNETFCLSILEALASDLPVVAMRRGGPVNLVRPGLGELATPGSAADFAAKIEKVAAERPARRACRDYVEQNYSWDRTFDRLLQVYERVILARREPAALPESA